MNKNIQKILDEQRIQNAGKKITDSLVNKTLANVAKAHDPIFRENHKQGIRRKTKTKEWKNNQLNGIQNIRSKGSWKENVKKGALKREQENTFDRKTLNQQLAKDKKWQEAVKKGMKDRWNKPENLTKCPHCNKLCDNANYKRWHGDNCKFLGK